VDGLYIEEVFCSEKRDVYKSVRSSAEIRRLVVRNTKNVRGFSFSQPFISVRRHKVVIRDSEFSNMAEYTSGGGINVNNGDLEVYNSLFSNIDITSVGGGINLACQLEF